MGPGLTHLSTEVSHQLELPMHLHATFTRKAHAAWEMAASTGILRNANGAAGSSHGEIMNVPIPGNRSET